MVYPWVKSIAHYLQDAGYRTHHSGKTHINPKSAFPFEHSGADNKPQLDAIDMFLGECKDKNTPFLLIAASNEPHTPWNKGDTSAYPPSKLELPPIFADTPETRSNYSDYLAEITYFDWQVGEVHERLDAHGFRENTLVIVLTEQGNSFPFAKWTCYDVAVASGCRVRWPGQVKPGSI